MKSRSRTRRIRPGNSLPLVPALPPPDVLLVHGLIGGTCRAGRYRNGRWDLDDPAIKLASGIGGMFAVGIKTQVRSPVPQSFFRSPQFVQQIREIEMCPPVVRVGLDRPAECAARLLRFVQLDQAETQIVPSIREQRIDLDRLKVSLHGLLPFPEPTEHVGQIKTGFSIGTADQQRLPV